MQDNGLGGSNSDYCDEAHGGLRKALQERDHAIRQCNEAYELLRDKDRLLEDVKQHRLSAEGNSKSTRSIEAQLAEYSAQLSQQATHVKSMEEEVGRLRHKLHSEQQVRRGEKIQSTEDLEALSDYVDDLEAELRRYKG